MHRGGSCGLIALMLAGHYAPAFAAAGCSRSVPLWLLLLAAQFVDVLWGLAILSGIERASLDPALPSNPLVLEFMPWTHSLAGTAVWSGLAYVAGRRLPGLAPRDAALVAMVVASHWFLDLVVHRPDLTIAGGDHRLGLAMWDRPLAAWLLEVTLVVGSVAYASSVRAGSPEARRPWWMFAAALVLLQTFSWLGPVPPTIQAVAAGGLVAYFVVAATGARVDTGA